MGEAKQGILLVADISGYTEFIRRDAGSASHARHITVRLLKAIVSAAGAPLSVAELEGDAVFFYAMGTDAELPKLANRVKAQIPRIFRAFRRETKALADAAGCGCDACRRVGDLRLKQVIHTGEVAAERIGPFQKLFGLAVIVVHRMLKGGVAAREYLMLSEQAHRSFGDIFGVAPERRLVDLDGFGAQSVVVYDAKRLVDVSEMDEPTLTSAALGTLRWDPLPRTERGSYATTGPGPVTPR